MTIVLFVLLFIGYSPEYKIIESIVIKHNDVTMEECVEFRELILEHARQDLHRGIIKDADKVKATPCHEIRLDEKL
jgi:hypothetical protein